MRADESEEVRLMRSQALPIPKPQSDKQFVEAYLQYVLRCKTMPDGGPVQEAMRYAVLGDAQRVRPILALRVARMVGRQSPHTVRMAAAVELIHCASLIIDDLPCMDNEFERRGRPSTHVAFGEATAILAAFGLVALAGRMILNEPATAKEMPRLREFQSRLLGVLDVGGLIAGQSLDLAASGPMLHDERLKISELKTVPLFDLAIRAGIALTSLPEAEERALLAFGRHFGLAFQMADDFADGDASDPQPAEARIDRARDCLSGFGHNTRELHELLDLLHVKVTPMHALGPVVV